MMQIAGGILIAVAVIVGLYFVARLVICLIFGIPFWDGPPDDSDH